MITEDVFGTALIAYANGLEKDKLWIHTSYGKPEEMPIWYFFRGYDEMPSLEKMALAICEGKVLDIGAGTGIHSMFLQQMMFDVLAIDTSRQAVELMQQIGVQKAKCQDYFSYSGEKFDTLLCLMHGLGFIGKLGRLEEFLLKAEHILNSGGQIILDSSDIEYLYEGQAKPSTRYYGEVSFQYEFRNRKSDWFDWVYIDKETLKNKCSSMGWHAQVLTEDENGQYLARLTKT